LEDGRVPTPLRKEFTPGVPSSAQSLSDSLPETKAILAIGEGPSGQFTIDANLVATGRTCVLGSSGSGKSYTVGVLCEELCRNGVPFAIIDTEGEHTGLKEKFEVIWVGEEEGCDLSWESVDIADLASQAPDIAPLVLDVSDLTDAKAKTAAFVGALYDTLTERRTPYLVVVEEADKFIPQYGERVPIFAEAARRGRKRGMGLMIASQRPSLVDKNVLSQCGNQLIGKLIIQNDLQSVAQFFPGKGLPKELTRLSAGQFYAMGGFAPTPSLVSVRKRITRPGGVTPSLSMRVVKKYLSPGDVQGKAAPVPRQAEPRSVDSPPGRSGIGLAPSIKAEDVPAIVRRERSFGLFGPRETVTSVSPEFRTLIQLGVTARRGLLKRRFETAYAHLDGATGRLVSIDRGLDVAKGFERLLGLTTLQVEVLKQTKPDSDTSVIDIASSMGEARLTVARTLGALDEKRLVRSVEVRRAKLYRRLTDLPGQPSALAPLQLTSLDPGRSRVVAPRIREGDVRDVVKGLWDGADVASFEPFLYPVYRVELVAKRRRREVLIDGRSGKELPL